MRGCPRPCPSVRALLILAWALLSAEPAEAQSARSYARVDSVSVGERFELVAVSSRPAWAHSVFPAPPHDSTGQVLQIGDVVLLRKLLDSSGDQSESGVDSVVYEATTFALDTAAVGPLPVVIVADRDSLTIGTPPFLIGVRSLVPADADSILDVMPIAEFPSPVWPWVLFIGVLILATAAFLYWYRRSPRVVSLLRTQAAPSLSPIEEATTRLDELEDVNLDSDDSRKIFFIELSDVLRNYLSRRLGMPALESTSREVLADVTNLTDRGDAPADVAGPLERILETSDLAKFAEIFPGVGPCRETLQVTRKIITTIEEFLTPAPEILDAELDDVTEES